MDYRVIPNTAVKISTIGIGGSHLHEIDAQQTAALIDYAMENGINVIDTAISYPEPLDNLGKALQGKRDKFIIQMHLGMSFLKGEYDRTRNLSDVKDAFEDQLTRLGLEYADVGLIHCVDEMDDYDAVFNNGVFEYALELKKEGKIKYLGFGSHTVDICSRFIETGEIDICMFSINAAYDMDPLASDPYRTDTVKKEEVAISQERLNLYKECEKKGIGIIVMKPYAGGKLLDAAASPFERVMSVNQCLQYALDRPATLSCVLGLTNVAELKEALSFYTASKAEKDYAFIAGLQHKDMMGSCVYCNHCLPCPAGIDIGRVHKYLDLYLAGDELARQHYRGLSKRAADCISCGSCEKKCPFHVQVRQKMEKAVKIMER